MIHVWKTDVERHFSAVSEIHQWAISQEMPMNLICNMCLEIKLLKLLDLEGASELTSSPLVLQYASVNRISIGSDDGLSPIRRQAII